MWDLPGPGLEPVFPALTGGFLTTLPPGKSWIFLDMKKAIWLLRFLYLWLSILWIDLLFPWNVTICSQFERLDLIIMKHQGLIIRIWNQNVSIFIVKLLEWGENFTSISGSQWWWVLQHNSRDNTVFKFSFSFFSLCDLITRKQIWVISAIRNSVNSLHCACIWKRVTPELPIILIWVNRHRLPFKYMSKYYFQHIVNTKAFINK